jgi:predicted aspartyl protease
MIKGSFLPNIENVPVCSLIVSWNEVVVAPFFVVDTGFTGDLKIDRERAQGLRLMPTGVVNISNASGQTIACPIALAYVSMEGVRDIVSIIIEDGSPLVGIGLFTKFGYKITIDCKRRLVNLEKVP